MNLLNNVRLLNSSLLTLVMREWQIAYNLVFVDVRDDVVDSLLIASWREGLLQLFDLDVPTPVLVEVAEYLGQVILTTDLLQVNGNCHKLLAVQGPISIYVCLEYAKI